jgi:TonB-linked SusC/RagA family outer membrane protein
MRKLKILLLLFLMGVTQIVFAQRTINGTITSAVDGLAIPGVSVIIKGTSIGTITDAAGNFKLPVPTEATTLRISFIGMKSMEVKIGGQKQINLIMEPENTQVDEVVVVGYGTQKKISITGAIASVESEFLVKSPNAAITNSLAGRVTGLSTVQYSGRPGGDEPAVYVRGLGSLTEGASAPLMLVDGVERSFAQLDPNEVESVSVLKDASATAVYGIRGANGVIIVTTKRGVDGAPKISFSTSTGMQVPTRLVDMADSYTYAIKHNEARLSDDPKATLVFSQKAIDAFRTGSDPYIYPNTDWVDEIVKSSAPQYQHNINITGGSKVVKYFVSLGYLSQDGLFNTFETKNSYDFKYQRYNYRANIDLDMTKSTKISFTTGGRVETREEPGQMAWDGVFPVLYWAVPYSGLIKDGKFYKIGSKQIGTAEKYDGAFAIGWGTGFKRDLNNVMNLDISILQKLDFITKGLNWRFKVSNNNNAGHQKVRLSSKATYEPNYRADVDSSAPGDSTVVFRKVGSDGLLGYSESSSKARNWYMESAFSFDRAFGNHQVTGLLLYNASKSYYPSPYSDIPVGYVGLAARGTYNYKLKYMFDFNIGYNGSENFAPGKRFGLFPAVAAAWVVTEENFLKDKIPFLSFLKFRFSYGVVGNDRQGSNRFLYLPDSYSANTGGSSWPFLTGAYSFGINNPTFQITAAEGKIGNPDVTWEKAIKQNYGFDLKVLKGKLGLTADFFYEHRNNILTTRNTVPSILSFTLPAMNIGEVENRGFEIELKWKDKIGKVNYYLTSNVSFARNKILFMDEIPKNEEYLVQTGRRVGERFGYVFDGFWSEKDVTHLSDFPDHLYIPKPGDARYKDLNNDKLINSDDQKPIGFPDYPEFNFSLSGGIDYKGFDMSMMWTGVTNVSRVMNDTWRTAFGTTQNRSLLQWLADNSWTPETSSTALAPRITFSGAQNNTKISSLWIRDASYIRLKNIELGYSFSSSSLKRLGISKMRIYTNGYNLLTFDKLKFIDPESRTSSADYPLVKIINLGLSVNF